MAAPYMSLLSMAGGLLGDAIDFFQGDQKSQAEALLKQIAKETAAQQGQIETNKIEAGHSSIFVAGWRPAIGWVCALGLAAFYIPQYLLATFFWIRASWGMQELLPYPGNTDSLMELVLAMLGMGLFRTAEKFKKVAR